jgi:membrane fusion protein, heavy metal efflux system
MRLYIKQNIILFLFAAILIQSCKQEKEQNREVNDSTENRDHNHAAKEETNSKTVELNQKQFESTGIKLGTFEKKNLKSVVRANGYLKLPPQNIASASTFMGGVVKKIHVIEGNYVKQGQILATLQHPDFIKLQEEYLKTKQNLNFLEKEYFRQKTLSEENVSSGKVFQQAEANYKSEGDRLNSLKDQIEMLGISVDELNEGRLTSLIPVKAPIEGYISKININTGSFAEPVKQLFEIVDNSHIHVDLMIYEKDWYRVKIGQKIFFEMPNQSNTQVEGVVFAVGKSFDEKTKSLAIHAEITNNKKYGLVPGIYVNALIDIGSNPVNALPDEAIVKTGGLEYIFVLRARHKENNEEVYIFGMNEVKTGTSELGYTEVQVLESFGAEAQIVTGGAYYLLSKMKSGEGGEEHEH